MQTKNKFNSTPNQKIGDIYYSRSCAVTVHLYNIISVQPKILALKRGNTTDCPYLWNLPCGYIDWDESAGRAAFREVWEESNIDLYAENLNPNVQPIYVNSDPTSNRQNITLHYQFIIRDYLKNPNFLNCEHGEVVDSRWLTYADLLKEDSKEWGI